MRIARVLANAGWGRERSVGFEVIRWMTMSGRHRREEVELQVG